MPSRVTIPKKLPLLVVSDVLLPGGLKKISISGRRNLELVRSKITSRADLSVVVIGVVPREPSNDSEELETFHPIGTAALVAQVTSFFNGTSSTISLLLYGLCRFRLEKLVMEVPYPVGTVVQLDGLMIEDGSDDNPESVSLRENFRELAIKLAEPWNLPPNAANKLKERLTNLPGHAADIFASLVNASYEEKLQILDAVDLVDKLKLTLPLLIRHTQGMNNVRKQATITKLPAVKQTIRFKHRPALPPLNSSVDGSFAEDEDELEELHRKLREAKLPSEAEKVATKELQRLTKMTTMSPEYGITRRYIELLAELPWSKSSIETLDIKKARDDLDADHYGLAKLKQRVLEHLAVRQLRNNLRGPLLCFVGPPGVGKTSVGRSIANSLGRTFHRISLGGVSNQSDIRGHRRTYIGAMPGRIISGLKTVGANNPVFLLDEVDKLGKSIHNGDPSAALLEVLDPEQNCTFVDHYLNVPFDLSQVMFIATANSTKTIPPALLDRMELIHIPGYTQEEKFYIAIHYLLPKQLELHGLSKDHLQISDVCMKLIISCYTREAGVRNLERKIGALCRAVAVIIVESKSSSKPAVIPVVIDEKAVEEILGPAPFGSNELWSRMGQPGVALGLAWTEVGGELLLVEASQMAGNGELVLTGQLGSVMRESAQLALNWVRTSAALYDLKIDGEMLSHTDIHIHFPEGAVGKDGPSAGVTIATALVSLFSGQLVCNDMAMTGEITLRGLVLPVGGVKDKVLAAHRAGLKRVLLPKKCEKDLHDVPDNVKNDLTFEFVTHMEEVIEIAFGGTVPKKLPNQHSLQCKL